MYPTTRATAKAASQPHAHDPVFGRAPAHKALGALQAGRMARTGLICFGEAPASPAVGRRLPALSRLYHYALHTRRPPPRSARRLAEVCRAGSCRSAAPRRAAASSPTCARCCACWLRPFFPPRVFARSWPRRSLESYKRRPRAHARLWGLPAVVQDHRFQGRAKLGGQGTRAQRCAPHRRA